MVSFEYQGWKNGVQIVQHLPALPEQGVVILDARLQAFQQRLDTRGLGRLAAHVQRMDDGADPHQGRVAFQPEARQQGFEGDAMADVGEARAVEIESQRIRRAVLDALQPDEARVAVDEAADQPGGRQPIHPQVLPGGPGLLLEIGEGETLGLAVLGMRFVGERRDASVASRVSSRASASTLPAPGK